MYTSMIYFEFAYVSRILLTSRLLKTDFTGERIDFCLRILKKIAFQKSERIQKILIFLTSRVNFDSKYTHMSPDQKSSPLESLMF